MAKSHSKGSCFERDICRQLSLWWTDGKRDDVFWRTAGSGARATNRFRRGNRSTYGQCGDVTATDPIGEALLKFFTIEIKKGYPDCTLSNALDGRTRKGKLPAIFQFVNQAEFSRQQAESQTWAIIHRRDFRLTTITFPVDDYWTSCPWLAWARGITHLQIKFPLPNAKTLTLIQTRLDEFLRISPQTFRKGECG